MKFFHGRQQEQIWVNWSRDLLKDTGWLNLRVRWKLKEIKRTQEAETKVSMVESKCSQSLQDLASAVNQQPWISRLKTLQNKFLIFQCSSEIHPLMGKADDLDWDSQWGELLVRSNLVPHEDIFAYHTWVTSMGCHHQDYCQTSYSTQNTHCFPVIATVWILKPWCWPQLSTQEASAYWKVKVCSRHT